jgi:outer membrane protein assembly factor BamA
MLALLAVASVDLLAPYRGQPVLSVDVVAPAEEDVSFLRGLIDIQPGFLLTSADVQAALKRLAALDRFAAVLLQAQRYSGVIQLTFVLKARRTLSGLRVEGVDDEALLEALGFREGAEIDAHTARLLTANAMAYLEASGYSAAAVEVEPEGDRFVVRIDPGEARRVEQVRFSDAPTFQPEVLASALAQQAGSNFNRLALQGERERLTAALVARGFLGAEVGIPEVTLRPSGATVTFPVATGPRVALYFRGNHFFSTASLRALWPDRDGRLRPGTLDRFVQAVRASYVRAGYAQATVDAPRFVADGVERVLIDIDEGPSLRVLRIRFEGAAAIDPARLTAHIRASLLQKLKSKEAMQPFLPALADAALGSDDTRARSRGDAVPLQERWVPEVYAEACQEIAAVYRDDGFQSVRLEAPLPLRARGGVDVLIRVHEGARTTIRDVQFAGNLFADALALAGVAARAAVGEPFSLNRIEDARVALVGHYRAAGFAYAQVVGKWRGGKVTFQIEEGPRVHVGTILVRGNHHTREDLIRSRIETAPGDLYRIEQVVEDRRALASLGVFANAQISLVDPETPAEQKDLVAEVSERPRQPVELSLGISSADGPRAALSYSHINVLGTATALSAGVKMNRQVFFPLYGEYAETMQQRYDAYAGRAALLQAIEREVRLGARSPRFGLWGMEAVLRLDLMDERDNTIPYSLDTVSATFGLELYPSSRVSLALEPRFSFSQLQCPAVAASATAAAVRTATGCSGSQSGGPVRELIDEGERRMVQVGPALTIDRRDNPLNPQSGFYFAGLAAVALGDARASDDAAFAAFRFGRLESTLAWYVPLSRSVLMLSARGGWLELLRGGGIPVDERFFLGGRNSLRGFVESTLIPEDACVVAPEGERPAQCKEVILQASTDTPPVTRGGNAFALLKGELRIPVTDSVGIEVFLDAGNLWVDRPGDQLRLRYSAGLGLRYNTPVGALALDIGVNLDPRAHHGEAGAQTHFRIGAF